MSATYIPVFFMLHLLLKLKMRQQVATSIDMAVSTTKLTDYNTGITWLIMLGGGLDHAY